MAKIFIINCFFPLIYGQGWVQIPDTMFPFSQKLGGGLIQGDPSKMRDFSKVGGWAYTRGGR